MEMQQIEPELAYVGYVKITDGLHVIKLCKEDVFRVGRRFAT